MTQTGYLLRPHGLADSPSFAQKCKTYGFPFRSQTRAIAQLVARPDVRRGGRGFILKHMQGGYVYILQSSSNQMYYIGSTIDLIRRVKEHNTGDVTATKNKGPWDLKFSQRFDTIAEARQIEYKIKKLKRRDYLEQIIKDGFIKMKKII